MRTWRWISVAAILALVLAACGETGTSQTPGQSAAPPSGSSGAEPSDGTAGEPVAGGTLVFAGARLAASLDPALTSDGESFRILQQVYEPLVDLAPGTTDELVGVLAESWEGGPEDTTYVFHLREGVKFHDGTDFNAEAVKINFDRMQNFDETDQASAYYYGALMDGFGPDNLIKSVEATDDLTVTINLREPSAAFLFAITLTPFGIISPAILDSTGADSSETSTLDTDVVQGGTGPFILEDYVPDDSATLVKNDDYWGGAPYLDRLIIRPIADPAARLQALQGGSIQGYDLVNPSDYEAVESDGFSLVERASFNTLYLGLNPVARDNAIAAGRTYYGEDTESPLKDINVRKAIAMAIDKSALIDPFYGGRGSVADTFMPPSSGWADAIEAAVTPDEFNVDGARQLLEDAGFTAENPAKIYFWYPTEVTRPYMPDPKGLHEAITQMLEDAGFEVVGNSDIWDDPGYLFDAQNGYYDLHFLGWTGDYDDPSNWYGVHFGYSQGEPAAQFGCDVDGLEDAMATADATLDEAGRGEAWGEVAKLIHDNVCFVTLAHGDTALAFTDDVQGYEPNPTGSESFKSVWLAGGGE
jgi:peptide/nickel transport system substrate-binding protein